MVASWDMNSVAKAFHDAALVPESWPAALDLLSSQTASLGVVLVPVKSRATLSVGSESIAEATDFYFREGWHTRDKRDHTAFALATRGIAVDLDITTEDQMRRDPYYQDFLGRFGMKWFAGIGIPAGEDMWCLSIQRSEQQGPFTPDDQAALLSLRAPLSTAAMLASSIGSARAEGLTEGLELAGMPAILLDREARVVHFNPSAEALLGSDLQIRQGRIVSSTVAQSDDIHCMIGLALGLRAKAIVPPPVAIRRAGHYPIIMNAVPLTGKSTLIFAPASALVLLRVPDAERAPLETELKALFALTRSEAKVALSLLQSADTVGAIAENLGISVNTARTHLSSVYRKTDTSRQSELVRLLSKIGLPSGREYGK